MAGKVCFSVSMSLDRFIAPEERVDERDMQHWTAQWMELQQCIFPQRFFRGQAMKPCCSRSRHDQTSDPEAGT
jgi:hypothetical protein